MTTPLKVCIPTAGTGSRLGAATRYLNKSLVAVGMKPGIAHIIDHFPDETEFVIALGHKGHLVREFLSLAYPHRCFQFADVDPFEGPGSGLGFSLLLCESFLRQPFLFLSCDTLVKEAIAPPTVNWMGWAEGEHAGRYRTLGVSASGLVTTIHEKDEPSGRLGKPYIGLAGIHDYETFWDAMRQGGDDAVSMGEAYGMRAVLDKTHRVEAKAFTWIDTGNPESLAKARSVYAKADDPAILEKPDEAIWFVGDQVIKYSHDTRFIADRVARVAELSPYVPHIIGSTPHMYQYQRVEGEVLSRVVTPKHFRDLLDHCARFWRKAALSPEEEAQFFSDCMAFYKNKTLRRLESFYSTYVHTDNAARINGEERPPLRDILARVDWDKLALGLPGRFHGDLHFENILWSERSQTFTFLDWRQNFGTSLSVGDIYYDLAKLLHGLIINHGLIAKNEYSAVWEEHELRFDFLRRHSLVECQALFDAWLSTHGYDRNKVYCLTALIYLNIATLHHYPYCLLLYGLGVDMLHTSTSHYAAAGGA